jgi:hypothetical protein
MARAVLRRQRTRVYMCSLRSLCQPALVNAFALALPRNARVQILTKEHAEQDQLAVRAQGVVRVDPLDEVRREAHSLELGNDCCPQLGRWSTSVGSFA